MTLDSHEQGEHPGKLTIEGKCLNLLFCFPIFSYPKMGL